MIGTNSLRKDLNLPRENGKFLTKFKDKFYRDSLAKTLLDQRSKGELGNDLMKQTLGVEKNKIKYYISTHGYNLKSAKQLINKIGQLEGVNLGMKYGNLYRVMENIKKFPAKDHKEIALYIVNLFDNDYFRFDSSGPTYLNFTNFQGLDMEVWKRFKDSYYCGKRFKEYAYNHIDIFLHNPIEYSYFEENGGLSLVPLEKLMKVYPLITGIPQEKIEAHIQNDAQKGIDYKLLKNFHSKYKILFSKKLYEFFRKAEATKFLMENKNMFDI